jgi:hypothetical protein
LANSLTASSLLASIILAMASALVKSIFPFKKARFENSPGVASLAPAFMATSTIILEMAKPP